MKFANLYDIFFILLYTLLIDSKSDVKPYAFYSIVLVIYVKFPIIKLADSKVLKD